MRKLILLIFLVAFMAVTLPSAAIADPPWKPDNNTPDGMDGDDPIGDPPVVPPWDDPWGPGSKPVAGIEDNGNSPDNSIWFRTDLFYLVIKIQNIRLIVMK
nr:hypothetical protein [candidate division Zixibacteria bacterium]